jgi:hypothetical protein
MSKRRTNKPLKKAPIDVADIVPIVGDAAIAGPAADGRLISVLIVDTTNRPDLDELVRLHSHLSPGDVTYRWGQIEGNEDQVALALHFVRPIDTRAVLMFSIEHQGILVESALTARSIYLQPGRSGDRLMDDLTRPRILIEVPDDNFRARWEEIVMKRMTNVFRGRGISPAAARRAAAEMLEQTRRLTRLRWPN